MIAAGTLLYSLIFKQVLNVQDEFGAITKTKQVLFKCRAAKVKNQGKFDINAKELFLSNTLIFKVRYMSSLNENLIVEYEKNEYNITSFDKNLFDNTVELVLEKINL